MLSDEKTKTVTEMEDFFADRIRLMATIKLWEAQEKH